MNLPMLKLPPSLKARLGQGHPWVYRNQIGDAPSLPSGTWVQVQCGGYSAVGLWDAESPIAVRILTRYRMPDARWVADRVAQAWDTRSPIRSGATTAYRWIYGESDGLPGIVVDLYSNYAVIRSYVKSVEGLVPWVADALHAHTRLTGILWRQADEELAPFWGKRPPEAITVEENGLLFRVELFAGQKTGLFFDHRDNRRTLAQWCNGRTVLDCFCYTGAFSLNAARAGASAITACDTAPSAVKAARQNFSLNGLDPDRPTLLVQDCFALLEQLASEGRRFGLVILDPPSLAHDRTRRQAAERAYVRLNQTALQCVEAGGLLASASCTSQVSPAAFHQVLAEAAHKANRRLKILHDAGQAVDHPVPAHFPEARYLKFVVGQVLDPF